MTHSLARIGVNAEAEVPSARAEVLEHAFPADLAEAADESALDFFVERDGVRFAGAHLLVDLWHGENLDNVEVMEGALRRAVEAANATLLHIHLHHFTPNGGVSGVAVLAESHISVHSWPETGFAAFDIFMCGDADPHAAVAVLEQVFSPARLEVREHRRGVIAKDGSAEYDRGDAAEEALEAV